MDLSRRIDDGVFSIVQNVHTKHIEVLNFKDVIYQQEADSVLPFEVLIAILTRERTKYYMREG